VSIPFVFIEGPQPSYQSAGHHLNSQLGYHAFFVTFVPFIPSFLSDDFTRMITGEASRIKLIASRQIRFLNDLSSCKDDAAETFDLRFVSIPNPGQPYNTIHIFFIGKVFHEDREQAKSRAVQLWRRFRSYFPLEDPFNYPFQTITADAGANGRVMPSNPELLRLALQPIEVKSNGFSSLVEIRKYEDRDPMLRGDDEDRDQFMGYYPHPFRPTIDFSAMSRFLETFAVQSQRCVASICLRPTSLSLEEQRGINQMMQRYAKLLQNAEEAGNWLVQYRKERFDDLVRTFDPLINQRNHLFMVKIQVIGEEEPPLDVVAALGSEIMNNSTSEPRLWSEVRPAEAGNVEIAFKNFSLLEFQPWEQSDPTLPLWRLSSLVMSYEAVGAFRLPVPPESGHLPGLIVRDHPFVLPATLTALEQTNSVSIGNIIHRGTPTNIDFWISLSQLKRHGLVAGSTGSGKTNTCLHILTELWRGSPPVPFLVIYPIDKPDYRLLQADPNVRDKLLIFTLGDDTTSPFRFNPFHVPSQILVRTHMSLLMRAFTAAFSMWDPLPAVYRAALRKTYEEVSVCDLRTAKGADLTNTPLLSRFYEILLETSEQMTRDYGKEAKGTIRQGAEIRIRDLLQNAGHVLNVEQGAPWEQILTHPTVMEIGRVGSTEDSSLVMGFLLMSLTSHLADRRKRETHPQQHITLIEEAHRLMSSKGSGGSETSADPRAKASEDFANILAEVRGFNEGILIAEQIPTELVSGAIGNTYLKIMHWLEEQSSFELFADILSLNKQQRDFARTLPTGQAILRGANGRPVLVQIRNYLDQFQHADDTPIIDDSDEAVHEFMVQQIERFHIQLPRTIAGTELLPNYETWRMSTNDLAWLMSIPMKSCAFCKVLHESGKCMYGATVRTELAAGDNFWQECRETLYAATLEALPQQRNDLVATISTWLASRFQGRPNEQVRGIVYCYLAHELEPIINARGDMSNVAKEQRSRARAILQSFGKFSHSENSS